MYCLLKCVLIGLLLIHVSTAWLNSWDQSFKFECPDGEALNHVVSQHNNHYEDRIWDLGCRSPPVGEMNSSNCQWTDYVNAFDQPMTFQCPYNEIIAGMSSIHDNHYEDRRFKFYCCELSGYLMASCYFTSYVNDFDANMDYSVPTKEVMRGVDSYHDNGKEDRRFKFEICNAIPDLGMVVG